MEGFRRLLTNFTYSLGSGLTAANQSPRGRAQRTGAGMGAVLQVPEVLRRAQEQAAAVKEKQAQDTIQLLLQAKQAETAAAGQQSLAGYRNAQDANADATRDLQRTTQQQNMDLKQQVAGMQQETLDEKKRVANLPKKVGQSEGIGEGGAPVTVDHMQQADGSIQYVVGPAIYKKAAATKLLTKEEEEQRIRIAQKSGVPPSQVVEFESPEGPRFGILDKGTKVITPVAAAEGATVTPKLSEVPAAVKTQGTAASTALKQVENIERIVNENPQLLGPIAGNFQTFMQGIGSNPFVGSKDERLGAQLSEHLNALFAQELRSLFPGRTNEQMQELIKSTSAQMKQNPNMLLGMLEGVKTNEGMVLEAAKRQGWVEERSSVISTGKPAAGKFSVTDPTGKVHPFDTQAQADAFKTAAGIK